MKRRGKERERERERERQRERERERRGTKEEKADDPIRECGVFCRRLEGIVAKKSWFGESLG